MLPPLVAPGNSAGSETYKYKAVAAGGDHSLAIRDNGELYSFGGNGFGQLGNGTVDDGLWVVQVGTDFDWESISAGGGINPVGADDAALNGGHSLAIKTDGTLWAWGSNYYGQLGLGTTDDATTPMQVGKERGWVRVSAGKLHSFAWKADGSLWGWGNNAEGQLGNGTSGTTAKNILVPTRLN
jgi:alpha-tubulin suppressor-like RCC1 family protein